MKLLPIVMALCISAALQGQSVKGNLTLNGKTNTELKLETNSVVQLFKEFKRGKYKLNFRYEGQNIPDNIYNENIVFFEFQTTIKKDGRVVKTIKRDRPFPYFPGEYSVPSEAFDFISELASNPMEDEDPADQMIGTIPEGNYQVELSIRPIGIEGAIQPLSFSFILRKRPGR